MSTVWLTSVFNASKEQTTSKKKWRSLLTAFFVGLIASQSVGCLGPAGDPSNHLIPQLVDVGVEIYRDRVWAKRAYNLRYGNCERSYGNHFRNGFIEGYCDVCNGGSGYVPAMPPDSYWSNEYQCADGAKCVNAWFEGYPAGAAAAKKDAAGTYRDVYISNMINSAITQEKAKDDLPTTTAGPESVPPLVPPTTPAERANSMPVPMPSLVPSSETLDSSEEAEAAPPMPLIIQPAQYSDPAQPSAK